MPEHCTDQIEQRVRHAAESGEILIVARAAREIASACGAPADAVAKQLTEAAVRAHVTLQFGRP